jgi:hypothetical protein
MGPYMPRAKRSTRQICAAIGCCATSWRETARPFLAAVIVQGTCRSRGRLQCSQRFV